MYHRFGRWPLLRRPPGPTASRNAPGSSTPAAASRWPCGLTGPAASGLGQTTAEVDGAVIGTVGGRRECWDDERMNELRSHRTVAGGHVPSLERRVTAFGLGGLAFFQLALATGAPWGRASYGGAHSGVLPDHLRVVSAAATLLYSGLTGAVVSPCTPVHMRRRLLPGVAGLMGVGVVMNGISPSWPERPSGRRPRPCWHCPLGARQQVATPPPATP